MCESHRTFRFLTEIKLERHMHNLLMLLFIVNALIFENNCMHSGFSFDGRSSASQANLKAYENKRKTTILEYPTMKQMLF